MVDGLKGLRNIKRFFFTSVLPYTYKILQKKITPSTRIQRWDTLSPSYDTVALTNVTCSTCIHSNRTLDLKIASIPTCDRMAPQERFSMRL